MHKQMSRVPSKNGTRVLLDLHRTYRVPSQVYSEIVEDIFVAIDTPVSLSCFMLYRAGEFTQLVDKEVDPFMYNDRVAFRSDLAAVSLLRKNGFLKTTYSRKQRALDSFKAAEESCYNTNIRLNPYASRAIESISHDAAATLKVAKRKIYGILRKFDVDLFLDLCTWGPGSTLLVKGEDTSASHKFDRETQITRDAHYLFADLMTKAYPNWEGFRRCDFAVGNKVITVPKNAKTDRTIAVEPGLNTWIQLGIGKLIRKRLRKAGYDLNSDLRNQLLAREGSITGLVATIDFKAASDTISTRLVENLLPKVWFEVMNDARSHYYFLEGKTSLSQKFSTMGNGFTFELESLIFLSIGLAACEILGLDNEAVSIFGDDLTLPVGAVGLVHEVCNYIGFTINDSKSFSESYFRESCGSYYFNGLDVKPFFIKKDVRFVKDLYRLANQIRSLAYSWGEPLGCDERFKKVWRKTVAAVPKELRFFGPVSSGDATIHGNLSESKEARRRKDGQEGFTFPGFPTIAITSLRDSHGVLLSKLYRPSVESLGNEIPKRAKTKICYKKRMLVYSWCDLGPWVTPMN